MKTNKYIDLNKIGRVTGTLLATAFLTTTVVAADKQLAGRVTDAATGSDLAGVHIEVVGGKAAAMTGSEGTFSLTVPDGRVTLKVEAPGFVTRYVAVRNRSEINITLSAPGASDSYDNSENVSDQSVADLQGSLFSVSRSGMPGSGHAVFVEGLHSINTSSQPLYVVDGVEWSVTESDFNILSGHYNNPLALIDPKDISSIKVIKNGTALYGTKGANGVICIETKRAASEATSIEAWAMLGFRQKPKTIPVMDGRQYRTYVSDILGGMFENGNNIGRFGFLNDDPTSSTYKANHNNTDWTDLATRNAITMNYGINVRGGDDRALYGFSLGYSKADGNLRETSFDRLNIRFNSDINLWDGFKLRFDVAFAQATWKLFDDGIEELSSPYYISQIKSPLYHPNVIANNGDVTLKYSDVDELGIGNPLSVIDLGIGESRNYRFNVNVAPSYRFNDEWSIKSLVAYSFDKIKDNSFLPDYGVKDMPLLNSNGEVYATMRNNVESLMNRHTSFIAKIYGDFNPFHDYVNNLDFRLGWRFRNDTYNMSYGQGYNTSSDYMNSLGNTTATLRSTYGVDSKQRNMAWFATASYSWMGRYEISADATMETSNVFGKNAPDAIHMCGISWGIFPSVNASWVISSEDFMSKAGWLNFARLRAGWGIAGNDNLPDFATRTFFESRGLLGQAYGLVIGNIGNDRLKWESTSTFRVGIDLSMFDSRWDVGADFYAARTNDLLVRKTLSEQAGLQYFWSNGGSLDNKGINITTNVRVLNFRNFTMDLGGSIGHYKNRVKSLADGSTITEIDGAQVLTSVGNPIGVFYGYKTQGVFATAEDAAKAGLTIRNANGTTTAFKAGDMHFVDNGDKEINDKDRCIIGDPNPDFFGNFNLCLKWGGLSLTSLWTFTSGNDIYNGLRANLESGKSVNNQSVALVNRWVANGQATDIPRAVYGDPMGNARFSDRWIEDGSYLKWKTLQLSYDLPINSDFIQGVSIWMAVNNLHTWTKYLGPDPESFSGISPLGLGIDNGLMSQSREFNFGVKIKL